MKHSKMKKAMGLKGFMSSMSKPKMKSGGFPDLNKDGEITKADILMGRGVISKPKGQMGMNVMKEAKKNATPSIPNSYYAMGGMKEENPLASMIKKKAMKKSAMKPGMKPGMKPKMGMGGMPPNAFGLGVQPLSLTKKDGMDQYYKKGGMAKKKKK